MKPAKLLSIAVAFGILCGTVGCASPEPEPEVPEEETLVGVRVDRSGGTVYGEDFNISVVPGKITYLYVYLLDDGYREASDLALTDGEWESIVDAVNAAELEEYIPPKPNLFEKILSVFEPQIQVLDGSSSTSIYLTWSGENGTREAEYIWPGNSSVSALWNTLFGLAQSKAASIPLEDE